MPGLDGMMRDLVGREAQKSAISHLLEKNFVGLDIERRFCI
jgi:hypothetical protein